MPWAGAAAVRLPGFFLHFHLSLFFSTSTNVIFIICFVRFRQYHDDWKTLGSREFDGAHSGGMNILSFLMFVFQGTNERTKDASGFH
jgi:hypothetical protein